jgi:hypothetical protein
MGSGTAVLSCLKPLSIEDIKVRPASWQLNTTPIGSPPPQPWRNPVAPSPPSFQHDFGSFMPLRIQAKYWILSAFAVATRPLLNIPIVSFFTFTHILPVAIVALLKCATNRRSRWRIIYYFFLGLHAVHARDTAGPLIRYFSGQEATRRQELAVHFCLAFSLLSEAEWWRCDRYYFQHPVLKSWWPIEPEDMCLATWCDTMVFIARFAILWFICRGLGVVTQSLVLGKVQMQYKGMWGTNTLFLMKETSWATYFLGTGLEMVLYRVMRLVTVSLADKVERGIMRALQWYVVDFIFDGDYFLLMGSGI